MDYFIYKFVGEWTISPKLKLVSVKEGEAMIDLTWETPETTQEAKQQLVDQVNEIKQALSRNEKEMEMKANDDQSELSSIGALALEAVSMKRKLKELDELEFGAIAKVKTNTFFCLSRCICMYIVCREDELPSVPQLELEILPLRKKTKLVDF